MTLNNPKPKYVAARVAMPRPHARTRARMNNVKGKHWQTYARTRVKQYKTNIKQHAWMQEKHRKTTQNLNGMMDDQNFHTNLKPNLEP